MKICDDACGAERVVERMGLYHALREAGFIPRDPLKPVSPLDRGRSMCHLSHGVRRARLGRKLLYPKVEAYPGKEYMDHREDWKHPDHPALWTAMSTWHVHGCLFPGRPAHVPNFCKGPHGYPKAWCGPSWYFPRAITGVVWHPDVDALIRPALAPFLVEAA